MFQMIPYNPLLGGGNNFPCTYPYSYCTPPINQQMCMPMQPPYSPWFPYPCQSPLNYCSAPPCCHAPTIYLTLPPKAAEKETPKDESPPPSQPAPVSQPPPVSQPAPVSQPPRVTQFTKSSKPTSTTCLESPPQPRRHENLPVFHPPRTSQVTSKTCPITPPAIKINEAPLPKQGANMSILSQMLLNLPTLEPAPIGQHVKELSFRTTSLERSKLLLSPPSVGGTPQNQNVNDLSARTPPLEGLKLLLDTPSAGGTPQNQNVHDSSARTPPLEGSKLLYTPSSVGSTPQSQSVDDLNTNIRSLEESRLLYTPPSVGSTPQNQSVNELSARTPPLEGSKLLYGPPSVGGTPQNQNVKDLSARTPPLVDDIPEEMFVVFGDEAIEHWENAVKEREAEIQALFKEPITDKCKPLIPLLQVTLAQKTAFVEGVKCVRRAIDEMKGTESQGKKERLTKQLESMLPELQSFYIKMFETNERLTQLRNELLHGVHPFGHNVGFNPEELNTSELFSRQNIAELKTICNRQNEYIRLCQAKEITPDEKALLQLYESVNAANVYVLKVLEHGENLNNKLKNAKTEEEKTAIEKDLESAQHYTRLFFERIKYLREQIAHILEMQEKPPRRHSI